MAEANPGGPALAARSSDAAASETRSSGGQPAGRYTLGYQPALDGIRALSVAAVLAFHAGYSWARGGYLGVDAFFVLSGYLITSLLIVEWRRTGRISLSGFWARRARRLLPALYLVLLWMVGYAVIFSDTVRLDRLREDVIAVLTGISNWWPLIIDREYFTPLRHMWSLSIEQQYYVVWPLLFLAFIRVARDPMKGLLYGTLAVGLVSVFLSVWLYDPDVVPTRIHFGTDTRAQSLLVGAALAAVLAQRGPLRGRYVNFALQVVALACCAAVVYSWWSIALHDEFLFRGGYLLFALAVAVVILAALQPEGAFVGRLLALPPLPQLGLISYGIYLWHWPVYWVLTPDRVELEGYPLFAARVALTVFIAAVSYNLIEVPFRRGAFRRLWVSWSFAPASAVCIAAMIVWVTQTGI
ncbi:MAG: acyltransferase [Dehalococcoidia bacterium]|nr:acyltransferase [Dehalococcoidia bacterium]